MPSCAVPTCKNADGLKSRQHGITFHLFPTDEERKMGWTKLIQRARLDDFWKPAKASVVCSIHFDEQDVYITKCGLKRLKKEALPNKNIALMSRNSESHKDSGPSTSANVTLQQSPTRSDSLIGDVNISDLDSVFDTPRKVKLKSQLRRKQLICKRHLREIKTLQQKNRRIIKKFESLKNILSDLRNNQCITDDVYDLLSKNLRKS